MLDLDSRSLIAKGQVFELNLGTIELHKGNQHWDTIEQDETLILVDPGQIR